MSQQINVNIRMDKDVKEQADKLFNELGFNFTTAINAFVRQSLRERAIPFYIKADNPKSPRVALRTAFRNAQAQSVLNGTDNISMEEIDGLIADVTKNHNANLADPREELYQLLSEGRADVLAGRTRPHSEVMADLKQRIIDGNL